MRQQPHNNRQFLPSTMTNDRVFVSDTESLPLWPHNLPPQFTHQRISRHNLHSSARGLSSALSPLRTRTRHTCHKLLIMLISGWEVLNTAREVVPRLGGAPVRSWTGPLQPPWLQGKCSAVPGCYTRLTDKNRSQADPLHIQPKHRPKTQQEPRPSP